MCECTKCGNTPGRLFDALESIVWYDGHYEWLKELRDALLMQPETESYLIPNDVKWNTEKHTIWMLLVGLFGDWGTSIRSGWIEKHKECAAFIDALCEESWRVDAERRISDGR